MGKRKPLDEEVEDDTYADEEEYEDEEASPKPAKGSASKKKKFSEPFVDEASWHVLPPSLIWRNLGEPEPSAKIAAFDLDGTLVTRKSNREFAKDSTDWKWFNKTVPNKLAELVEDGFKICVFSNQGGIKAALNGKQKEKVEGIVELMHKDIEAKAGEQVPLQAFLAPSMQPGDPCRKPNPGMWRHMVEHCNGGIQPDLKASFFVGDADGSLAAHSSADSGFAEAVGLTFHTPQDYFGPMEGKAQISRDAVKAAAAAVESGDNPNAELVSQFMKLSDDTFEAKKAGGPATLSFKAAAYKTAAQALSTYPEKISENNLKEVGKLKGVGKGTVDKIKRYLQTGSILSAEDQELAAGGAAAAAAAAAAAPLSKERQAAFTFM